MARGTTKPAKGLAAQRARLAKKVEELESRRAAAEKAKAEVDELRAEIRAAEIEFAGRTMADACAAAGIDLPEKSDIEAWVARLAAEGGQGD